MYYCKHLAFTLHVLNCDDLSVRLAARESLQLHMSKRKAISDLGESSFAGYATSNGKIVKESKVNWPKSILYHVFGMCQRENISLRYSSERAVFWHESHPNYAFLPFLLLQLRPIHDFMPFLFLQMIHSCFLTLSVSSALINSCFPLLHFWLHALWLVLHVLSTDSLLRFIWELTYWHKSMPVRPTSSFPIWV